MSVAADIILIITAILSNGNLSYTLNVFKTKHFLKSTQLVTRSEELVATVLKFINNLKSLSQREGRNDMHIRYTKRKAHAPAKRMRMRRTKKLRTRRCK